MVTFQTTVRDDALTLSTDLAQAGAVLNNATRSLDGGFWKNPADNNNQIAYFGMYTTDITAVLNNINGVRVNPGRVTVGGTAYALSGADTAAVAHPGGANGGTIPVAGTASGTPGPVAQSGRGQGKQGRGPIASGGGNDDGQGDPCHGHGDSGEHGDRRPVPSFWNFAENEHVHNHGAHRQFEPMRHHA
jgi:hypothetical protein